MPFFRKPRIVHEQRMSLLSLLAGLPAVLTSMIIIWTGGYSPKVQWTLTLAHPRILVGLLDLHPRACRIAASHAGQSARGHARGRLFYTGSFGP